MPGQPITQERLDTICTKATEDALKWVSQITGVKCEAPLKCVYQNKESRGTKTHPIVEFRWEIGAGVEPVVVKVRSDNALYRHGLKPPTRWIRALAYAQLSSIIEKKPLPWMEASRVKCGLFVAKSAEIPAARAFRGLGGQHVLPLAQINRSTRWVGHAGNDGAFHAQDLRVVDLADACDEQPPRKRQRGAPLADLAQKRKSEFDTLAAVAKYVAETMRAQENNTNVDMVVAIEAMECNTFAWVPSGQVIMLWSKDDGGPKMISVKSLRCLLDDVRVASAAAA